MNIRHQCSDNNRRKVTPVAESIMRITRRFNDNLTKLNGTKYNSVENLPSNLCNSWMPDPEKTSQNRGGAAPRIPGESVPESWMSCWGIVTREESSRFVSYCQLMGTVIASNFIELRWGGMGNGRNGEREEWGTGGMGNGRMEEAKNGNSDCWLHSRNDGEID